MLFKLPLANTLLTHARKTGYDEYGHTVPWRRAPAAAAPASEAPAAARRGAGSAEGSPVDEASGAADGSLGGARPVVRRLLSQLEGVANSAEATGRTCGESQSTAAARACTDDTSRGRALSSEGGCLSPDVL